MFVPCGQDCIGPADSLWKNQQAPIAHIRKTWQSPQMASKQTTPRKVLIIGGGFAGLECARKLANDKRFEVTLLDRTNHHLFQPLLYQVATASLAAVATW